VLDLIKVIILGIVEGITEFLPISSTGHLIVATALLKPEFSAALSATLDIFIQVGAVVAVVLYYRADLWRQVTTVRTDRRVQRFWLALLIAFIPAAGIGFVTRSFVKAHLFSPAVVAISLIVGGVLFLVIERVLASRPAAPAAAHDAVLDVTFRQALVIGVVQTLALIPGVSRSAASIFGGMFSGLSRETATRFSFYLAIPTLGLATVVDLVLSLRELQSGDLVYLVVGAVVSGIVAWFAIGWLLRYVAHNTFTGFGFYRIAVGVIILLLIAAAVL
jgi:undecaprenyl-diphosphatase